MSKENKNEEIGGVLLYITFYDINFNLIVWPSLVIFKCITWYSRSMKGRWTKNILSHPKKLNKKINTDFLKKLYITYFYDKLTKLILTVDGLWRKIKNLILKIAHKTTCNLKASSVLLFLEKFLFNNLQIDSYMQI